MAAKAKTVITMRLDKESIAAIKAATKQLDAVQKTLSKVAEDFKTTLSKRWKTTSNE